jgi:TRAP-type C4-dicarboxylate transport system substrate-binding protein
MKHNTRKIRWVLAHEPYDLFLRAAEKFSQEVKTKTHGQIEIEVLGLTEYVEKYLPGQTLDRYKIRELVDSGVIEMSQMYTTTLGLTDPDMFVLDMPFIFRDHEHAARVLDGEIGQQLMDSLAEKSNIKGLAFTYSGGFRAIIGNRVIESVEDLAGMKVRVAHSPVAEATMRAFGAEPVVIPIENLADALGEKIVDSGESTYPRIYSMRQNETATVINHTEHSLFLTTIIMNKGLWNDLTVEQQMIFADAALSAAHVERAESLEDVGRTRERAQSDGIKVVDLDSDTRSQLQAASSEVYETLEHMFTPGLIESIQRS